MSFESKVLSTFKIEIENLAGLSHEDQLRDLLFSDSLLIFSIGEALNYRLAPAMGVYDALNGRFQ